MIRIYCVSLCPYSDMLKNLLKYHNIEFENIDISRNEKAKQEMIEKSGQSEITPVIEVDGQIFIGFDREKNKRGIKNMIYDLIIIGAGAAGLTAALYAHRYNLNTLIISKDLGGTALEAHSIENFPGYKQITGIELMKSWTNHIKSLKIETQQQDVINVEKQNNIFVVTTKDSKKFQSKTVILALGMKRKHLNVEGEDKFLGKGISYCATCDAPLYKNKIVAVIGGGDTALMDAQMLTKHAKKVYIIHRRDELRAEPKREEQIKKNKKIEIIYNTNIKEIKGNNFVKSILLNNNTEIKVDGIFIDVGFIPSTDIIKKLNAKCDEHDYIIVNNKQETNIPGLFAAGDITFNPLKQIITAAAEGAIAAFSAFRYIVK